MRTAHRWGNIIWHHVAYDIAGEDMGCKGATNRRSIASFTRIDLLEPCASSVPNRYVANSIFSTWTPPFIAANAGFSSPSLLLTSSLTTFIPPSGLLLLLSSPLLLLSSLLLPALLTLLFLPNQLCLRLLKLRLSLSAVLLLRPTPGLSASASAPGSAGSVSRSTRFSASISAWSRLLLIR